jgi:hypothetical protein
MPIRRLREYAALARAGAGTEARRLAILEEHRAAIVARVTAMQDALAAIDRKLAAYGGPGDGAPGDGGPGALWPARTTGSAATSDGPAPPRAGPGRGPHTKQVPRTHSCRARARRRVHED